MRAIVLASEAEAATIDAALGYPRPGLRTDHTIALGSGVTLHHRETQTDKLARTVYVVDDVESALPTALRTRVVAVTLAVVAEEVIG